MPRDRNIMNLVAKLINPTTGTWYTKLMKVGFWKEDAALILSLPMNTQVNDFIAWHYD